MEYFPSSAFCRTPSNHPFETEGEEEENRLKKIDRQTETDRGRESIDDTWKNACQRKSRGRTERARNRKAILGVPAKEDGRRREEAAA